MLVGEPHLCDIMEIRRDIMGIYGIYPLVIYHIENGPLIDYVS